ncbi:hypothetical protein V8E54_008899 [Elaphomyces granulatus]
MPYSTESRTREIRQPHGLHPALFVDPEDGKPAVPILLVQREFEHHGVQCTRRQGLALEWVVIDLEFVTGQTYVAISRVKTLRGLLFETSFEFEYFTPKTSVVRTMRLVDMQRRRLQLLRPL